MIQIYVLKKFKLGSYKQDIKLSSYRKDKLRQARNFEFIDEQYLSEVFLAYVLHQYGILKGSYDLLKGENGRPYISPPAKLFFSSAHNKTHICIGIAHVCLGIDVENKDRKLNFIEALVGKDARYSPIETWVLKESIAKLTSKGLSYDFKKPLDVSYALELFDYEDLKIGVATHQKEDVQLTTIKKFEISTFLNEFYI